MLIISRPNCYLCGSKGRYLYQELKDYLFGVPGEWNFMKCTQSSCGLVWLNPIPSVADSSLVYATYYTHNRNVKQTLIHRFYNCVKLGYLAINFNYKISKNETLKRFLGLFLYLHPGMRAMVDSNVMYLPADTRGSLLDIGCGDGYSLNILQNLGWQVEGLDIDALAVEQAKKYGLNVSCTTLESKKYPDSYFDVIILKHTLEHLIDPLQTLKESYRILKASGRIVVATPNIDSWGHKLFKDAWRGLEPPRHINLFSNKSLNKLFENCGFKKIQIFTSINGAYGIFKNSMVIAKTKMGKSKDRNSFLKCFLAAVFELKEWLFLKTNPNFGEEIVLTAYK